MQRIIQTLKRVIDETDKVLLFLCIAASAFGVLGVTSATHIEAEDGQVFSRSALTMLLAVVAGIVIAVGVSFLDCNIIFKLFPLIGGVCLLLMFATLIFGVGPLERPDAKTWLTIGSSGLYFQPSELLKIGFIITFAMHIELVQDRLTQFKHLVFLCVHAIVPVGLVVLSGDMGSALVFIIIFIVMIFTAGVQMRYFLIGLGGICVAAPFAWYFVLDDIQKNRVLGLFYPDLYEDVLYQQNVGMSAMRNGGIFGKGFLNGDYTNSDIVPEMENDMIYTAIAEEFGLIGCLLVLAILAGISARLVRNAAHTNNNAAAYMCYGMAAMVAGQAIINIGMCLKLLPVIGITLPFLSAGGSSNLCIYLGVGLMLSIYRFNKDHEITNFRYSHIATNYVN